MRKGILTQAAYQRSVYRKLKDDHPALSPYSWKRCTKIPLGAKELVVSEILMTGREKDLFVYAAARAVTAVAAEGGHPFGVRVSVLVPEQTEEDSIKEMTEILKETAKEQGFQILNILTEVCPDADVFTVSVTGFGTCESTDEEPEKAYDGKDLVLVNPVALEGSLRVLHEKEVEIRERFVPVFLQKLLDSRGTLFAEKAVRKAEEYHAGFYQAGDRRRSIWSSVGTGGRDENGIRGGSENISGPPGYHRDLRAFQTESISDGIGRMSAYDP